MPDPLAAITHLPKGVGVLFRHYDAPKRAKLAAACCQAAKAKGQLFLVAGDSALAARIGADGVHMPEGLMAKVPFLRRAHPKWIITAAAHSLRAVKKAESLSVDAILLSPVFKTKSHVGQTPLGILRFTAWTKATPVPIYALGGISDKTAPRLLRSGAIGIAAIGGLI